MSASLEAKLKVLHVTPEVFGPGSRGGGERYVSELVAALMDVADVDLFCVPSYGAISRFDFEGDAARRTKIRDLVTAVRQTDIVHVHQLNSVAFDIGVSLAHAFRKPTVLTDHGGGYLAVGRVLGRTRLRWINRFALVSGASADDLGVSRSLSSTIWGGGDHVLRDSLTTGTESTRSYDFVYVGRIMPHKGLHVAVSALPEGATLLVCGEIRDPQYWQYVQSIPTAGIVEYNGPTSDDALASTYRSGHYTLVPSVTAFRGRHFARPELLGLVALESLACGTPVVGSRVGGLGEVLDWANQTSVGEGDLEAWARALKEKMSYGRPRTVDVAATWKSVSDRCLHIYRDLAA